MQPDNQENTTQASPCTPRSIIGVCKICGAPAPYDCYPRISGFPIRTLKTIVPMCVEHAKEVDKRIGEVRL